MLTTIIVRPAKLLMGIVWQEEWIGWYTVSVVTFFKKINSRIIKDNISTQLYQFIHWPTLNILVQIYVCVKEIVIKGVLHLKTKTKKTGLQFLASGLSKSSAFHEN